MLELYSGQAFPSCGNQRFYWFYRASAEVLSLMPFRFRRADRSV